MMAPRLPLMLLCGALAASARAAAPATDAKALAAEEVKKQAQVLLQQAELFGGPAGSQLTDAPELHGQLQALERALAELGTAGGPDALRVRLRTHGFLMMTSAQPKPLGADYLKRIAADLGETARQALAAADSKSLALGPSAIRAPGQEELRDAPASALPLATKKVDDALARARQAAGAPDPKAAPTRVDDKTAVVSRYEKGKHARYDQDVFQDQQYLKALGYLDGDADGRLGPKTDEAIRKFKRELGFPDNGDLTQSVRSTLRMRGIVKGIDVDSRSKSEIDRARREQIEAVQKDLDLLLRDAGARGLSSSGAFDRKTKQAVCAYQKRKKMTVTCELDAGTIAAIRQDAKTRREQGPVLYAEGDKGPAVKIIQHKLNRLVPEDGRAPEENGRYDADTSQAVRDFQTRHDLTPTGYVDAKTWKTMRDADPDEAARLALRPARTLEDPGFTGSLGSFTSPSGRQRRPVAFISKMDIDADGGGSAWRSDPAGQPGTSLRWRVGRKGNVSPDPTRIPYVVLTSGYARRIGARLGDLVEVVYSGRRTFAIYADNGPRLGEASIRTAQNVGINADPRHGGTKKRAITYIVYPGSAVGVHPVTEEEILAKGLELSNQARGGPLGGLLNLFR